MIDRETRVRVPPSPQNFVRPNRQLCRSFALLVSWHWLCRARARLGSRENQHRRAPKWFVYGDGTIAQYDHTNHFQCDSGHLNTTNHDRVLARCSSRHEALPNLSHTQLGKLVGHESLGSACQMGLGCAAAGVKPLEFQVQMSYRLSAPPIRPNERNAIASWTLDPTSNTTGSQPTCG